jgi:hypothetical protein
MYSMMYPGYVVEGASTFKICKTVTVVKIKLGKIILESQLTN